MQLQIPQPQYAIVPSKSSIDMRSAPRLAKTSLFITQTTFLHKFSTLIRCHLKRNEISRTSFYGCLCIQEFSLLALFKLNSCPLFKLAQTDYVVEFSLYKGIRSDLTFRDTLIEIRD